MNKDAGGRIGRPSNINLRYNVLTVFRKIAIVLNRLTFSFII